MAQIKAAAAEFEAGRKIEDERRAAPRPMKATQSKPAKYREDRHGRGHYNIWHL